MIKICRSSEEIKRCYPVINQLHEELSLENYLESAERFMRNGYRLISLEVEGVVRSVAGFHVGESFAWKKYLYVDDLVTDKKSRSMGYGEALLEWIENYAKENGCVQLHLDSRVIRHEAHKFYINHGFIQGGYHFHKYL